MTITILLILSFILANLPWYSNKLFYVIPLKYDHKNIAICLCELIVLYFVVGGIAFFAEKISFGQIAPQGWEFYTVTFCLFLVFSFPGFIYRHFWK